MPLHLAMAADVTSSNKNKANQPRIFHGNCKKNAIVKKAVQNVK